MSTILKGNFEQNMYFLYEQLLTCPLSYSSPAFTKLCPEISHRFMLIKDNAIKSKISNILPISCLKTTVPVRLDFVDMTNSPPSPP